MAIPRAPSIAFTALPALAAFLAVRTFASGDLANAVAQRDGRSRLR